jgi:hypothetical protein
MMLFFMALFFNGPITIHRRDRFSPTVAYRQQLTGISRSQKALMSKRNHSANAYPAPVAASLVFLYGRRFGYAQQAYLDRCRR